MKREAREPVIGTFEGDGLIALISPLIRLEFERGGESWAHRLVDTSSGQVLASSFEADAERDDRDNPVSPSYQEISLQRIFGDPRDVRSAVRALAIGRFGPHHYATTFTVAHGDEIGTYVSVDIADRCPPRGRATVSTYTVRISPSALVHDPPWVVVWDRGEGRPKLRFALKHENQHGDEPIHFHVGEAGRGACRLQASREWEGDTPTQRFGYSWTASAFRD